jgi:uncharacterized protein YjbI with pentapeptide repeats
MVGSRGEVIFLRCTGGRLGIVGDVKLTMQDCKFSDANIDSDDNKSTVLLFQNCNLNGSINMQGGYFSSITIRDTSFDHINLMGATIKGDALFERVTGGYLLVGIKEGARSFTLRDSRISGNDNFNSDKLISVYAGAFKSVLAENVEFTKKPVGHWIGIGGGYNIKNKKSQPVMTETIAFRNLRGENFRSSELNANNVLIEGCDFMRVRLHNGKINNLTIRNTRIAALFDTQNTQVLGNQSIDLESTSRQNNLDGSNIRLPVR